MSDLLGTLNDYLNVMLGYQKSIYDFITVIRVQTPIKITKTVVTDDNGCIGGGLDTPDPVTLYECPSASEAWLHRIIMTSPAYPPASPLMDGQMLCTGSTAGEIIFYLPLHTGEQIVPNERIQEGSKAAPHLNGMEKVQLVGDQLPPHTPFHFHFQLELVVGISGFTPMRSSPSFIPDQRQFNGYQPGTTFPEPSENTAR